LNFKDIERHTEDGLVAKVFNNSDFGYYKVVIDRPARLKAQFTKERIADLRFEKSLQEPMQWAFETYGERVYSEIKSLEKEIFDWCEKSGLDMNAKKRKEVSSKETWQKQKDLLETATLLLQKIGTDEYNNFNVFSAKVEEVLKTDKIKLSASEKNQIFAAVSWYDETAEKVIKKTEKLSGEKLDQLLHHLDCKAAQLLDFGYYPTGKKGEYIIYENQTDLRDSESIPLAENIHDYFLREVKPHVAEAWIDLDKTKIGYEISFNKYFYQHKPLRSMEEVSAEILTLEQENEGLIMDILNLA